MDLEILSFSNYDSDRGRVKRKLFVVAPTLIRRTGGKDSFAVVEAITFNWSHAPIIAIPELER